MNLVAEDLIEEMLTIMRFIISDIGYDDVEQLLFNELNRLKEMDYRDETMFC